MTIDLTLPIDSGAARLPVVSLTISSSQQHQIAVFWSIFLALLGALIFLMVWRASRQRSAFLSRLDGLREAAEDTLAIADAAAAEIDQGARSGKAIDADIARDHSLALDLLNGARTALGEFASSESLSRANEEAAEAIVVLTSVKGRLNLDVAAPSGADLPGARCFYCALDDQPPYTQRTIEDDRGHSITFKVCATCAAQLERGRTPQIATVGSRAGPIPWYASPRQAWYLPYGGPAWQYWLPRLIGMDCASWFSGGWQYAAGWQDPAFRTGHSDAANNVQGTVHAGPVSDEGEDRQDDAEQYDISAST